MKKITLGVLVFVLVLSMALPALAEDTFSVDIDQNTASSLAVDNEQDEADVLPVDNEQDEADVLPADNENDEADVLPDENEQDESGVLPGDNEQDNEDGLLQGIEEEITDDILADVDMAPSLAAPITISTVEDLINIKDDLNGNYVLGNDIDLSGVTDWVPIGDNSTNSNISRFTGTFDGQGHEIKNMTIETPYAYIGLFGYANDAAIENVKLTDININISVPSDAKNFSAIYAGGLCGYNYGFVSNSSVTGKVSVLSDSTASVTVYAGGICGYTYGSVSDSESDAEVKAYSATAAAYAGGICGYRNAGGAISNCINTGNVFAGSTVNPSARDAYAGGICGYSNTGVINSCYNTGKIFAFSSAGIAYTGGISGYVSAATISACYNTEEIYASSASAASNAGGIYGFSTGTGTVKDCYNIGNVTASSASSSAANAGGISGTRSGSIITCYSTGDVSAASYSSTSAYAGGISGGGTSGTITSSYWNSDSIQKMNWTEVKSKRGVGAGTTDAAASLSLTTANMKKIDSFKGFDFSEIWGIWLGINQGYPFLLALPQGESILLTVDTVSGIPGDEVDVKVVLSNNQGIAGFSMQLNFDNTKLTPVSVSSTLGTEFTSNVVSGTILSTLNYVTAVWYTSGGDFTANGNLFTVKFKINDMLDASDIASLILENVSLVNKDYEPVMFSQVDGEVIIMKFEYGVIDPGNIPAANLLTLAQYIAEWPDVMNTINNDPAKARAADVNADGVINVKDLVLLAQFTAGVPGVVLGPQPQ